MTITTAKVETISASGTAADTATARLFRPSLKDQHYLFDLPGFARRILKGLGIGAVESVYQDTYGGEDRFFSYRRATHQGEEAFGCLLSAITLES